MIALLLACVGEPAEKEPDFVDTGHVETGHVDTGPVETGETGDSEETGDSAAFDTAPVDDRDGDGAPGGEDCDDTDASVHPGAGETCDGRDEDCDGVWT